MSWIKASYGIACCRINANEVPEILMIQKKCTHSFASFILHCDKIKQINKVKDLFNGMTVQEKIDIRQLDYDKLWKRVSGIDPPNSSTYLIKKAYFDTTYKSHPNKINLLLHGSRNANSMWDIPKGRKKTATETDCDTALREFEEETLIIRDKIRLFYKCRPIRSCRTEGKWKYINQFYIAEIEDAKWDPYIEFNCNVDIPEVQTIEWMSIERLRALDTVSPYHKHLIWVAKKALDKFKKHRKLIN